MNKFGNITWGVLVLLFAVVLPALVFTPLLVDPGHLVPQLGADGGKNAYVLLYQLLYGKGAWSSAMNYPYGEHITFIDGQPLLSLLLPKLGVHTVSGALTAMWRLVFLSYVLAIVFLYRTMALLGVVRWRALVFAGLIACFTPQILRIQGHYGLSYSCVLPMLYYWSVCYHRAGGYQYPAYILLLGIITTLLHPYFSAVILVWVGFYAIGYLVLYRSRWVVKARHLLPLLASVALLFMLFGLWMHLTDPVKDRPVAPYGAVDYCVTGRQIITSELSPFWLYARSHHHIYTISDGGEGYTYLGLVTLCVVFVSLVAGLVRKKLKKVTPYIGDALPYQPIWLFMAACSLLLSMGVPFVWNMEWLLDYLSYLRQFRALGRFSWLFYYLITVYGVVVIDAWARQLAVSGRKIVAGAITGLCIGIWAIELTGYAAYEHRQLTSGPENYNQLVGTGSDNWTTFLAQHGRTGADFQALLMLKLFNIGTDKLWLGNDSYAWGVAFGAEAGLQLHLPWIDAFMSRSSWSLAQKQVKLAGGPLVQKKMLADLPNDKPLLVLHVGPDALDPDQAYLLNCADKIGHYKNCDVYSLTPSRLRSSDNKIQDSLRTLAATLPIGDTILGGGHAICLHYDGGGLKGYYGGAHPATWLHDSIAAEAQFVPAYPDQTYEFSCWFLLHNDNYRSPYLKIEMLDSAGAVTKLQDVLTKAGRDNEGMWFRAGLWFTAPPQCRRIRIRMAGDNPADYIAIDELLIRPIETTVFSKNAAGVLMVNNHKLGGE